MDLMKIAVDPGKELNGVEVRPWKDDTVLIVARYNNSAFRALQVQLMEPLIAAAGRDGISTEQAEIVLAKTMAKTLLLGWTGLFINGQEIKYSPNKCQELLLDARFIDFKEIVMNEAQTLEHYRLKDLEGDLGNLKRSSSTTLAGRSNGKNSSKTSKKKKRQAGRPRPAARSSKNI